MDHLSATRDVDEVHASVSAPAKDPFAQLEGLVEKRIFEPFIRHIRFPRFKNLAPMFRIDFDYPITALVGPNGTNKSSILRALQGCPETYNIGNYWFSTDLDPIAGGSPQRYIHGYSPRDGLDVEAIKVRTGKVGRTIDYFETSRPRSRDGMEKMPPLQKEDQLLRSSTRWRSIDKHVVYLDFRQELSAYDILFHFNWRRHSSDPEDKKALIRRHARRVSQALDELTDSHIFYGSERILEEADELTPTEVNDVSVILGRKYTSIRLVKHDYFGVEGYTARLKTAFIDYSEAYAGSGEFAAIMLVRAISRSPKHSLILLDEPETSLHPAAQAQLVRYLARECLVRKHQVVMATHSSAMIDLLPNRARKLLDISPSTGKVEMISQAASVGEAFSRLGHGVSGRKILVEDELARALVEYAARVRGTDFLRSIDVIVSPGGAQSICRRYVPTFAQIAADTVILLDGDQRPTVQLRRSKDLLDEDVELELTKLHLSKGDILTNGGNDPNLKTKSLAQMRSTLDWAARHVDYLPGESNPEVLLLKVARHETVADPQAAKDRWMALCRDELGLPQEDYPSSADILATQRRAFVNIDRETDEWKQLMETLERAAS
ncbi:ATP-dependent endonuclease [Agromyces sp. NDB4Y10]|uniref:ATP-dependent nuclease n=1 Tax=Agromyces sp. NDB4Y10 TaxID=1775951 RepID=UPI00082EA791|nr:ATP-binding protein [Agromyces sp. NDB4Y10]